MKIKATQPFTHAGQAVNTGDVIDVPADAAAWLIAQGVAETSEKEEKSEGRAS
nr:MAG TPA: hypothetical protein [Caudoviricetes sp.]